MCSTKRRGASLNSIIPYTLPKLHTGKNWYIDFKAYDPLEQKMNRKKYKSATLIWLESMGRYFKFPPIYIVR